ncbi:hypothetical protein BOX37_10930 [Nocardia mangyaensis]|uniref:Uncharacterized protein n=2 Tax=Nocardia mangyaensis TaxID=2213200 RepID=A0A1J0VR04_9NOCA|nr:hypothetical protein BOX37_10930 [Nocardia mangyaensis]
MSTVDVRNGDPMTTPLDALDFDGEPFDVLAWTLALEPDAHPAPSPQPTVTPTPTAVRATGPTSAQLGADPISQLVQQVRSELVAAHLSAMAVQTAWQRQAIGALGHSVPSADSTATLGPTAAPHGPTAADGPSAPNGTTATHGPTAPGRSTAVAEQILAATIDYTPASGLTVSAVPGHPVTFDLPAPATSMNAFKMLARTPITAMDGSALAALARGEIAAVFGPAYDQDGANPEIRLTDGAHGRLVEVLDVEGRGGQWARGRLAATCRIDGPDLAVAATEIGWQAAQVLALRAGLHLCLAGARFQAGEAFELQLSTSVTGPAELVAEVVQIDLLPRPWLRINAEIRSGGAVVARVYGLTLEIREAPGLPIGPAAGGAIPRFFGRRNVFGQRALLGEFHMTHSARGDLGIALGPEFSAYTGRRATRMPNHGLQLCDRVMAVDGERGTLTGGTGHTEYDSPADAWYYAESANASMPNVVYMETSLQSALLLGYFLGATLTAPAEDYSLRNLDGTATVLREVDLRDKTIQQTSRLLDTTVLTGAVLQTFAYELAVDGEPFYAGESLFGFFNARALANQNGLDNGELVPPWLDSQATRPVVRVIDVAARRAAGTGMACASGHLAMLDAIEVVDGGGTYGHGYLRAVRPVGPDDWFFGYHFFMDPVMPGSLGVEAVLQAMQEWAVDTGLAAELEAPEFVVPVGVPLSWRYRGQILSGDAEMTLEVHIKSVERRRGRIRVIGEASVWKPSMRIYELTDVAVELRDAHAEPW